MEITSHDNPTYKTLLRLTKKKYRAEMGLCIVEGEKLVTERAHAARFVFVRKSHAANFAGKSILDFDNVYILDNKLFDAVGTLETTQGIMAVLPIPTAERYTSTEACTSAERCGSAEGSSANRFTAPFLVLDGVQDPGNMGALLRSGAAFGFRSVFCIDCADAWSPRVLRAAAGTQFLLNIFDVTTDEFVALAKNDLQGAKLFIAEEGSANDVGKLCGGAAFGLVMGNEGHGISAAIKALPHEIISISMKSCVDSLNVAVAGGIIMYELSKMFN